MKNKLAVNIKSRMRQLRMTQTEFAKLVDISQTMAHKLTSGKTQYTSNLNRIAEVLQCTPEWLLFGEDADKCALVGDVPTVQHLPLIEWEQINARLSGDKFMEEQQYPCHFKCGNKAFAIRVQGVSMESDFRANDIIYVDPDAKYQHGSYVIAKVGDGFLFRRLVVEGGKYALQAINTNVQEGLTPTTQEHIIGTVVSSLKMLV